MMILGFLNMVIRLLKKICVALAILTSLSLTVYPQVSSSIKNDTTQAQFLEKLGDKNKRKGKYVEAGQNYLDASQVYEYHDLWSDYLSMLNDAADSYRRAGKLQKAEQIALNSIEAGKIYIENPSFQVAKAYHTLGIIKDYLSQFNEAIQINNLALDIYLALDVKPLVIADVYNSLGVNYLHLADHYRSLENLQKTLEIFQQHLDPRHQKVADLYLNMGSTYLAMGKYELAREYYEQEMSITTENMGAEHPYVGETSNNLGTVHAYLGNIELSESYFLKALQIFTDLFGKMDPKNIDVYHNLGLINSQQENFEKALFYFEELEKTIKVNLGGTNIEMAKLNLTSSLNYLDMGNLPLAQDKGLEALEFLERELGPKNPLVAKCYISLARIAKDSDHIEKALDLCQKALIANTPGFYDLDISKNPNNFQSLSHRDFRRILELKSSFLLQAYIERNDLESLENSLRTSKMADLLISNIHRDQLSFEDKLHHANKSNEIYKVAVKASYELYEITKDEQYLLEAFYFSDRSKAAVLRGALANETAEQFGNVPIPLLKFESQLNADRNRYQGKLQEEKSRGVNSDSLVISNYQHQLFTLNRTHDSLISSLENDYPQYYSLKYKEDMVSIENLQKDMQGGTILEYFYDDENLFCFVITKDRFLAVKESIPEHFTDGIQKFRETLSENRADKGFNEASTNLFNQLIAPVKPYLISNQPLTIVPHGLLSLIPFEILSEKIGTGALPQKYLLEDHPISYAFSASSMVEKNNRLVANTSQFLGFAPSYNTGLLASSDVLENYGELRNNLANLHYTDDEISTAASYFDDPITFSGENATESKFKSICSQYKVLHLAMHAIVDQSNPLSSKLIFTNNGPSGDDDGFLTTSEIYSLNLNADLTILSACNTAFGKLVGGEGVMSLGRAFAFAGCPSIVMSLWPAQDQATSEIMGYFYQALSEGESKDLALRKAKLQYLANADDLLSHPFYWANFIIQGDPKPLYQASYRPLWIILVLVLMGLLTYLVLARKNTKYKNSTR